MRLSLIVAAPLLTLLATGGVQAAASPEDINNVLASCPAETAGTCDQAISTFAGGLSEADRDSDLLNLANALADKASGADLEACGELKMSIQVAADAASTGARDQIASVAEPLCDDTTATGSVAPAEGGYVVPESLIEQNDGNL